jgi:nucleoside-diphosphate-sugar epimerase
MNNVLIIGASGFLGNSLINSFQQSPSIRIGALNRNPALYIRNVSVHYCNVLNYKSLESIIEQYDVIINCIGQITSPISDCLDLNTIGMMNIVKSVKKSNKRLIHISSVSVYGNADNVNETSNLNPETPYGALKCFSEFQVSSNLEDYSILRISNLFGKTQKKGVISYLKNNYLKNNPKIVFNNDGTLKRYYLNVDDLSNVIVQICKNQISGTYNIIGEDFLTIKDIVFKFESILHFDYDVQYHSKKPAENIKSIDDSKLKLQLPITSLISMDQFITEFKK